MRTTLDIDDDVLQAAKEIAQSQGKTAGQVVSEMFRRGFFAREEATPATGFGEDQQPSVDGTAAKPKDKWPTFPLPPGPRRIFTMADYRKLLDEIDREDLERAMSPRR